MGKPAVAIELSVAERRELQLLSRAQKTGQAMARRARIVLAAASGLENKAICAQVGADANTVGKCVLGPVEIHRELMTAAARLMIALKL